MRTIEVLNKVGHDKDNPVWNVEVDGVGVNKDKKIKKLKRSVMVPENATELIENIGGESAFAKFAEIICEDYSLQHVRAVLAGIKENTPNDEAVAKLLDASVSFTLATVLQETERNSATKIKAAATDAISALMALNLDPAEFQARVAAELKKL